MARAGTPKPPGSGRRRGSIDREQRKLLTNKLAGEIWTTFKRLGKNWLFELAKEKPELFVSHFLSRLLPPALKDPEPDSVNNLQVNIGNLSDREIATRIAFALSLGMQDQQDAVVEARQPYTAISPQETCTHPEPAPDAAREEFFKEIQQSPEERLNAETLDERTNRMAFRDPPRPSW